ncbi:MAG TPA: circadian clock protein KaiC [Pseudomonadota bacterium]|nr:circadian clock protein KaiC [Pseudomonadota bacterium]
MKKTVSSARLKGPPPLPALPKAPTGVTGLDEITGGGLPAARPTLVCGTAGCGKTLFSLEFLVRGALEYGEPGVFVAFEETAEDLQANAASLGFDLQSLIDQKLLIVDYIHLDPTEFEEAGDYDLEGLFIRLEAAVARIGAKRIVLDTLEVLFASLTAEATIRAELRRLFGFLKSRKLTALITAERGSGSLTRHGLEEYVSDCVILLDHRIVDQISTRRLRVVKYRGTRHGTNEYPFLIGDTGFSVLPITSMALNHQTSTERIATGVARLDAMLGHGGYYRGSSVLISGTAGSGKSSLAALFADACCQRGERCIYFAFEESPAQIVRNMRSIGLNLQKWIDKDLLRIIASRPTMYGLEMHLAIIHKQIADYKPTAVIVDPITNLSEVGSLVETKAALTRLLDFLKAELITSVFLSLTAGEAAEASTDVGTSSLMDTWILLRNLESSGERNRGLYILKSRGMEHSHQIREFRITGHGVELLDAYLGSEGVLMGSARLAQEAKERAQTLAQKYEIERQQAALVQKRKAMENQIELLRAEYEAEAARATKLIAEAEQGQKTEQSMRQQMARLRDNAGATPTIPPPASPNKKKGRA